MNQFLDTVYARVAASEHVRPSSKWDLGYLQVVLPEFRLHRRDDGRHLEIKILDDPLTIRSGLGKNQIEVEAQRNGGPGLRELEKQLAEFDTNPNLLGCRLDCANWPMRFSNGGVLPVVHLDGRDYFLMFYRDIFPIGWNIANGASDDTDEWLDPTRIIEREFGEEVLFCDPIAKRLFVHDPPGVAQPLAFHEEALAAWTRRRPEIASFTRVPMPVKWIHGPDTVSVTFRGTTQAHEGVFLSVTPPDHGIEVDRVAIIRLSGDIRPLDGEIARGTLFNHVVGLFDVRSFHGLDVNDFRPDRIFYDGREYTQDQLEAVIHEYLEHVGGNGLRREDQVTAYQQTTARFDLCPVSRAVIKRYFDWLKLDQRRAVSVAAEAPAVRSPAATAQVFISHRSTHVNHARALTDYLKLRGHTVFFSDETLAKLGESDYERSIGRALDQARVLILIALEPEDLASGWVDFEWKAFHCELLSGRKQGHIFSFLHNVRVDELPLPLRSRQSIAYSPESPFDSFDNLYRYVEPALTTKPA